MNVISRFFGTKTEPRPALPVAVAPANPLIGLRDDVMRGWFNGATGELFSGFAIGPDDVVADIGCGTGGMAQFCARQGARLILADIDPACVLMSAERVASVPGHAPYTQHVSDAEALPIADASCSKIICAEVIEHVESPARLLAELARIGRPGAQYMLTCPDPGSEAIQQRLAPPSYFAKPNHLRIIGHDELAGFAEAAGLVVTARHSYGFFQTFWWALYWACDLPDRAGGHPLLDQWSRTWQLLLDLPEGAKVKHALDDLLPKSQMIIATKPV